MLKELHTAPHEWQRRRVPDSERKFVEDEVITTMNREFPRFNILIDGLDIDSSLRFVDMAKGKRKAVNWFFSANEFTVSVGEIYRTKSKWHFDFEFNERGYYISDSAAVWCATAKRDIRFALGDDARRTELLKKAIEEVRNYLDK